MSFPHLTLRQLLTTVMSIVLALQACVLPAAAQSDPAGAAPVVPANAASPEATYSLSGRIVTPEGDPVPDVTVKATRIRPKDMIIFLPGVMGTELRNDLTDLAGCAGRPSGKLWADLDNLRNLTPLYLNDNGDGPLNDCDRISPEGRVIWPLVDWLFFEPPYESFISAADNEFDVLVYDGYDWRLSLTDAVEKLDNFINDNADGKLFLVAHGMGGLLARAYVADIDRARKVDRVVTIGTPYLGAPLMAQRMVSGVTGTPVDWLLTAGQIKEIVRYSPGIQQLLPSLSYVAYLHFKGYYVPATGATLDTYEKTVDYFVAQNYLRANTLDVAESFHVRLDGFDENFYAQGFYTVLYSTDTPTPTTIREKSCQYGAKLCVDVIARGLGDGTVPQASASLRLLSAEARAGVTFCAFSAKWPAFKEHGDLLLDGRVIYDVLRVLKGEQTKSCKVDTAMQATAETRSLRQYTVWGEGRVQVVDEDGHIDGGGYFTGVDENGILIRGLADVTYLITDGGVILTMPSDAAYQLAIHQTGSRPMQVVVSDWGVNPNTAAAGDVEFVAQAQAVFDNVPAVANGVATVQTAAAPLAQLTLAVDTTGDGTPEVTLNPGTVITDPVDLQDMTMPATILTIAGLQNEAGQYTGAVTVSLTAQDSGSGMLRSYTSLDNGQTWQEYTAPLQIQPGQASAVQVYSVDKAGNQEYPPVEQPLRFAGQTNLYLPHVQNGALQAASAADMQAERSLETSLLAGAVPLAAAPPAEQPVLQPAAETTYYTTTTNADGSYTFASLPAGTYGVSARGLGWTLMPVLQTVKLKGDTDNINFTGILPTIDTAEMVFIPDGSFQMGCDSSNPDGNCLYFEIPVHTVDLSDYSIDKYEVTNARYKACVDGGGCTAPKASRSTTRSSYYDNAAYADFPVIFVDWSQAQAYCNWVGKRLPTEAEWEKAARGSRDMRKYPWGDAYPDCYNANSYDNTGRTGYCIGDTNRVGSYPSGASPYDVMDMAGNVEEWVNDVFDFTYYSVSPPSNPRGPQRDGPHVIRGGSWRDDYGFVRSAGRDFGHYSYGDPGLGFRCARSQ